MILTKENLARITAAHIDKPSSGCFSLPEKVLQFGTGVLLRGLPDYFIDKANKQGIFNGRVVVVKSTDNGGTDAFAAQDCLYTQHIRGYESGSRSEETVINASISRVLSAQSDWLNILACAANSDMQIIISNTTEVGIKWLPGDDVRSEPPRSFPGKLTAFLYARFNAFHGADDSGMVIIPTELIPDNGRVLKEICVQLAKDNELEDEFVDWLVKSNDFCSSLVDSIVPGALPASEAAQAAETLGYEDDLHITSEKYRLWAIQTTNPRSIEILSFSQCDEGVIVTGNIDKFRELKLRLLNGAHTLACGLAVLSGFNTVKEAMANTFFESLIRDLMVDEIVPTLTGKCISEAEAIAFSTKVLDRFRNPFIEHQWQSICGQYSSKMATRCIPVLLEYYRRKQKVPLNIAAGFGAYIMYMNSTKSPAGQYIGSAWDNNYVVQDDMADILHKHCHFATPEAAVHAILADVRLWGTDLSRLAGFEQAVMNTVRRFLEQRSGAFAQRAAILAV